MDVDSLVDKMSALQLQGASARRGKETAAEIVSRVETQWQAALSAFAEVNQLCHVRLVLSLIVAFVWL